MYLYLLSKLSIFAYLSNNFKSSYYCKGNSPVQVDSFSTKVTKKMKLKKIIKHRVL